MAASPVPFGVLGAARITPLALIGPATATGTPLVTIAARSRSRAEAFAREHGIDTVADSYEDVIGDDAVEAVYNPLPNGLHGQWTVRALEAGKHVLSEKPAAVTGEEARRIAASVATSGRVFMEGFHFPYHPLWRRTVDLIAEGAIGQVTHVDARLLVPAPDDEDPRWDFGLAGGSTMDLGCYSFAALTLLGQTFLGGPPTITAAKADERADRPGVDERLLVEATFPNGVTASGGSDMAAEDVSFVLTVTGTKGVILVPSFPTPHTDDTLILRTDGGLERLEQLGKRSSYTYQLEAFLAAVRDGATVVTDAALTVTVADLIDSAYTLAGLPLRRPSV